MRQHNLSVVLFTGCREPKGKIENESRCDESNSKKSSDKESNPKESYNEVAQIEENQILKHVRPRAVVALKDCP